MTRLRQVKVEVGLQVVPKHRLSGENVSHFLCVFTLADCCCFTILVLRKIKSHSNSGRFFCTCLRGSMTDPPYHHGALRSCCSFPQQHPGQNDSPAPQGTPAEKSLATRAFAFTIRAYFPTPAKPTQFDPVTTMNQLFCTMLKDESSLVLCNPANDKQVILESTLLPTGKNEFQKFCTISTT